MALLTVNGVKKTYTSRFGGAQVEALRDMNFTVEKGEYVAIMGESGSGKTTLLNLLAALDQPTAGEITLDNKKISTLREGQMASFRRQNMGFVFQDFNLLDTMNAEDNILLPLVLSGVSYKEMKSRLTSLESLLDITAILRKFPYEISGGEKQRVAIARALISHPQIVLADEPTGALDFKNSERLLDLFAHINQMGQTILMVTHSARAASRASRVLFIKDGIVFHQVYRGQADDDAMFQKISDTWTLLAAGEKGKGHE